MAWCFSGSAYAADLDWEWSSHFSFMGGMLGSSSSVREIANLNLQIRSDVYHRAMMAGKHIALSDYDPNIIRAFEITMLSRKFASDSTSAPAYKKQRKQQESIHPCRAFNRGMCSFQNCKFRHRSATRKGLLRSIARWWSEKSPK